MSPLFLLVPILFPILFGFLLIPFRIQQHNDRLRDMYAEGVVLLTTVFVWTAMLWVRREPVEIYSFTRGFSIDLKVDGPGLLYAGMISVMWPLVMLYAFDYMKETKRKNMFFAFYIMTYGVTLGIAFAANMTTMYVFFEMLTLVTVPLVAYYQDHDSMFSARKYAAYTIGGAGLGFFAVVASTVYGDAGSFVLGGSLGDVYDSWIIHVAFLFGFFGFGVKAALFPVHDWLPTASAAPTPVTALLHAVAVVNSGVFAIVRLVWYTFDPQKMAGTWPQQTALVFIIFTLVYAAGMAQKERHFKRRLAYSTVSNLSYMLFGILLMTPAGLEAGLLHMLFHGIIKMTLFLCAGVFMHVTGRNYMYEINGVGRWMPTTFVCFTLAAFSLIGIPGFCGFVSKWYLIRSGLESDTVLGTAGAFALIIAAFLCAMYTLNVSVRAFFPMHRTDQFADRKKPFPPHVLMLIPIVVFCLVNMIIGVHPQPVVRLMHWITSGI